MDDFKPLSPILQGYYDLDFEQLQQEIQEYVSEAFFPIPWNRLSAEQRQRYVESWDYRNNPATEPERERIWKHFQDMKAVERDITELKMAAAPTVQDVVLRKKELVCLEQKLAELKRERQEMRGDFAGISLQPLPPLEDKNALREAGRRNATLQHTEKNRLYNEVVGEVRMLWGAGDQRQHSQMVSDFRAMPKYAHLSKDTLLQRLRELAMKMGKSGLIRGLAKSTPR